MLTKPIYESSDKPLGACYEEERTTFRLWAPISRQVKLALYASPDAVRRKTISMIKDDDNTWSVTLEGDLAGQYYTYLIINNEKQYEVTDPYGLSSGPNSIKSAVVDLGQTNPPGFLDHKLPNLKGQQAILYEGHIRDLTTDPLLELAHPGKFLAFTEEVKDLGYPVFLDHIKSLGVTHLHLLPILDFATVDEKDNTAYNWGYDPVSYFVPEGSYVVDLSDPHARIRELKEMVMALHKRGLGLVVDVVYNHTFRGKDGTLNTIVPDYYHRINSQGYFTNGSGCGNELASEMPMVRRLIIDSLCYLAKEFKVDGFRFDLMALTDLETVLLATKALREINPNILLYGEPWTGAGSALPPEQMTLKGTQQGKGFSLFNDDYRNAIKGDNDGHELGYVQGDLHKAWEVKKGISGSIAYEEHMVGFTQQPWESINYVAAHDNLNLLDKMRRVSADLPYEDHRKMVAMSMALLAFSFGIPFIHEGTEMMRTKFMNHNSYNAGDDINQIKWQLVHQEQDLLHYCQALFALRKKFKAFDTYTSDDIRAHLVFSEDKIILYELTLIKGPVKKIIVAFNPLREAIKLDQKWTKGAKLYVYDQETSLEGQLQVHHGKHMVIPALSTMVVGEE